MAKKSIVPQNLFKLKLKGSRHGSFQFQAGPTAMSPRFTDPPTDVIRSSKRFFISPACTGSLVEEACLQSGSSSSSSSVGTTGTSAESSESFACDCMAVMAESVDPCEDFRRSMEEMVVSRQQRLDWLFLEDLLSTYLMLNEKSVHGYIFSAFEDLMNDLLVDQSDR